MATRVSYNDFIEIVDTDRPENEIAPFIKMANLMVNANLLSFGYSDALLKEIERNLAAHFASSRDAQALEFQIAGNYTEVRTGKFGDRLSSTPYGQNAMTLDTSGTLSSLGLKRAIFQVYSEYDT